MDTHTADTYKDILAWEGVLASLAYEPVQPAQMVQLTLSTVMPKVFLGP